jgi:hypothetical protein
LRYFTNRYYIVYAKELKGAKFQNKYLVTTINLRFKIEILFKKKHEYYIVIPAHEAFISLTLQSLISDPFKSGCGQ